MPKVSSRASPVHHAHFAVDFVVALRFAKDEGQATSERHAQASELTSFGIKSDPRNSERLRADMTTNGSRGDIGNRETREAQEFYLKKLQKNIDTHPRSLVKRRA